MPKQIKQLKLKIQSQKLIERALWAQGIRKPLENGEKRHEFKADHGFRKYFKTMTEKHMKSLHVEMLMGHATGLADNYYRISEDEMLSEYLKAVPALSVYNIPPEFENEQIENIRNEMMRLKFDIVGLVEILKDKKLITNEIIKEKFPEMQNHVKLEDGFVIVKNTKFGDVKF
ncbi:hypothetical protein NsoK4_06890 [Nitrosopumilus sp. K4]|uniref:hypothetical protein n=1 Tax=Nitrosopumilus sp. K4 TaxID=2795383 RepID=UPI001BA68B49|nr:hypothetical protein [Nitrosopumilus sp. K4]QUC64166.1 hypothetical protein NsoK4_06890 [Nitrosopumilus sp. K4]